MPELSPTLTRTSPDADVQHLLDTADAVARADWWKRLSGRAVFAAAQSAAMGLLASDVTPTDNLEIATLRSLTDLPGPLPEMSDRERTRYDLSQVSFVDALREELRKRAGRHLQKQRAPGVYRLLTPSESTPAIERESRRKVENALSDQLHSARQIRPHLTSIEDLQRNADAVASGGALLQAVRRPSKGLDLSDPANHTTPTTFKSRS